MALSDLWQLTLTQSYGAGGESMLTNFFFQRGIGATNAEALFNAFKAAGSYLPKINTVQASHVKNVSARVINLGDPSDFYEAELTGAGVGNADPLPAYAAYGFTLKLNTRAIRPGSRRLPGVVEDATTLGIVTSTVVVNGLNDLANAFKTALPFGGAASYVPVVVKRVEYDVPNTTPQRTAYRIPQGEDPVVVGNIVAVLVNLKVTHQVSRGNGR